MTDDLNAEEVRALYTRMNYTRPEKFAIASMRDACATQNHELNAVRMTT